MKMHFYGAIVSLKKPKDVPEGFLSPVKNHCKILPILDVEKIVHVIN